MIEAYFFRLALLSSPSVTLVQSVELRGVCGKNRRHAFNMPRQCAIEPRLFTQLLDVMDGFDTQLSTIVEFSIGLGGFSAIVSAFLHQSGKLAPVDRFRTMTMLVLALMPAFIGFFCTGLMLELFMPDDAVRITSGVFAICIAFIAWHNNRSRKALPSAHRQALSAPLVALMYAGTVLNTLIQALSAAGFLDATYTVLYYGLVFVLFQGVVQFIRILIGSRATDAA